MFVHLWYTFNMKEREMCPKCFNQRKVVIREEWIRGESEGTNLEKIYAPCPLCSAGQEKPDNKILDESA